MPQSRQLAVIMFTDIVGYTALMGRDEQKAFEFLKKNRAIQKPVIEEFNGRWIKELGDGVMASFNTVSDAVYAAIKIQQDCSKAKDFQLRIGIHLGEVVFENDDVFGDGVNIAARIQSVAEPGSIYVSESVHHNVANKKDIQTRFVKAGSLKNVKEPVKMYEVVLGIHQMAASELKKETIQGNSIAVLPFANMSSDPEQEFFSDGISEEIINMLAQVPGLKVAGRTSSFSFKGKNQDLRIIGEQLGVNHILEGSVRKAGNKLRITAQLIKVEDGFHLYSEKFDRELEDVFDIQDEISLAILNAIKIKLLGEEKDAVLKRYTSNIEAYQLYLQGRFHVNQYTGAEAFKNGIKFYEAAIKVEPNYALAYAGMAWCWLELWFFRFLSPEQCLPPWKYAIQHALELDDALAESHLALADMKLWYDWDFENAAIESQKAIELNPNRAEAYINYAFCLVFIGKYTKACEQALIAYNLDPLSLMNHWFVGWTYFYSGALEKMMEIGKKAIALEPNFFGGHMMVSANFQVNKQYEAAAEEMELALKLNHSFMTLGQAGILANAMKDESRSNAILSDMETLGKTQPLSNCDLGLVHTFRGDYDSAIACFEKAIELREGFMVLTKDNLRLYGKHHLTPAILEVLKKVVPLNVDSSL